MSFGNHLRGLREAAGLSRAGLARRAAVPASTLRNWEGDRDFPGVRAGLRLAEALRVTPERLAEGVEDTAEEEAVAAEGEGVAEAVRGAAPLVGAKSHAVCQPCSGSGCAACRNAGYLTRQEAEAAGRHVR
jgi:transcriptional regulator with XRE-family HTH domain